MRAAAADTLIPMADQVVRHAPLELTRIVTILWDALPELDDLSASTNSILKLLARFLKHMTQHNPEGVWVRVWVCRVSCTTMHVQRNTT